MRRGLENVAIQVYLTAAVINLKRLAAAIGRGFYIRFHYLPLLATIFVSFLRREEKKFRRTMILCGAAY